MIDPMWPTGSVHKWREMDDSPAVPIGPAMTTLRSVIAPLASMVRSAGVVYVVVQVVIWHSFYTADQWRLAGPAVAVAWGATVVVCLRRRWPSAVLAESDSAVYVALALCAQGCVPPQVRDDLFGWLVISMSGQLIVPAWYAPGALSAVLTLLAPAAYWVGAQLQPVTDRRAVTAAAAILVVVGLFIHTLARRELYRRAAGADQAVAEAAASAGEQYAILSRNIERREHERLIHDTVLNTLTALARARDDDADEVVSRCRRDVALIEDALGAPDDLADGTGRPSGDVVSQVWAVVAERRGQGLTVHLDIDDEGAPAVPARVAAAISNATREALSNVAAHAGTGEAWVRVRLRGDGRAPRRLQVIVRDRGAGFDLARVDQGRLGLRRSIAERAADCGGQASIRSAPGQGTEVDLSWPASPRPGEPNLASLVLADHADHADQSDGALAQEGPSW
jgi:signal transduction histidine kinase